MNAMFRSSKSMISRTGRTRQKLCKKRAVRNKNSFTSTSKPSDGGTTASQATDYAGVFIIAGGGMCTSYCLSEYGFATTHCTGPSMLPTLNEEGDVILYEKLSYRLFGIRGGDSAYDRAKHYRRITAKNDKENDQQKWRQGIHTGDVVVAQHMFNGGTVCKRVAALPGDIVKLHTAFGKDVHVVPDGHVWLEGDNSINSNDSRHYGAVPASLIVGRVLLRIWPIRQHAVITKQRPEPANGRSTGSTITPAGDLDIR